MSNGSGKFKIFDWAGNKPFGEKTFETFEDAWEHVYEYLNEYSDDEFDEACGEYDVREVNDGEIL